MTRCPVVVAGRHQVGAVAGVLRWAGAGPVVFFCVETKKKAGAPPAQGMGRAGEQARGYPSDLADAQWQVIAPHLPPEVPGRRGRPRIWPLRRIIEAILYLDRAGCAWRYLPSDFPPWPTVYGYFATWHDDGTLARLHDALRAQARRRPGRRADRGDNRLPSPSAPPAPCPGPPAGGITRKK